MSKQKQIQELVPIIYDKLCKIDGTYHNLTPDKMLASVEAYSVAEMITDLNYRKESEVVEKIIKVIYDNMKGGVILDGNYIVLPINLHELIQAALAEREGV